MRVSPPPPSHSDSSSDKENSPTNVTRPPTPAEQAMIACITEFHPKNSKSPKENPAVVNALKLLIAEIRNMTYPGYQDLYKNDAASLKSMIQMSRDYKVPDISPLENMLISHERMKVRMKNTTALRYRLQEVNNSFISSIRGKGSVKPSHVDNRQQSARNNPR